MLFKKPLTKKISVLRLKEEDKIETQLLVNENLNQALIESNISNMSEQVKHDIMELQREIKEKPLKTRQHNEIVEIAHIIKKNLKEIPEDNVFDILI